MVMIDDRTADQRRTHRHLIIGTDSFLSGWGEAQGGVSYAAWACRPQDRDKVFAWVHSRSDMKRVREILDTDGSPYRPKGQGHCHIYVVNDEHPALS